MVTIPSVSIPEIAEQLWAISDITEVDFETEVYLKKFRKAKFAYQLSEPQD